MSAPPADLLVVGHVTRDLIAGEERLGGAAGFVARAASALGLRCTLVTAAPSGWPQLDTLAKLPGVELHVVPSEEVTTFALDYDGAKRRLRLHGRARTISPADVPAAARQARVAYIGPVAGECRRDLVETLTSAFVIVGAQGWLRGTAPDGAVIPALLDEAKRPPAGLGVVVLSDEDHPDAEALAARFSACGAATALTRGPRGATLFSGEGRFDIEASPAVERDPTGAGDVFGLVLGLCLAGGAPLAEAGAIAADAAARVVEGPGLGGLPGWDQRRLAPYRPWQPRPSR